MTLFGHPLHPMTVHFPIAFYVLGVLLTLLFLWRKQENVEQFAFWCFILSGVSTIFASVVGLVDQSRLDFADPRRDSVNSHITAGVALMVINGLLIYMRFRWPDVLSRHRWAYLGLMLLGLTAVLATAWLGADLVYNLGVGVKK